MSKIIQEIIEQLRHTGKYERDRIIVLVVYLIRKTGKISNYQVHNGKKPDKTAVGEIDSQSADDSRQHRGDPSAHKSNGNNEYQKQVRYHSRQGYRGKDRGLEDVKKHCLCDNSQYPNNHWKLPRQDPQASL